MKSIAQIAEKKQRSEEKKRAKKKERIVWYANKHGKSIASRKYQESLSNIKRWCKQYDGTWQSLLCKSRRPHSHPRQHTLTEEADIIEVWTKHGCKGMDYVYSVLVKDYAYTRTVSRPAAVGIDIQTQRQGTSKLPPMYTLRDTRREDTNRRKGSAGLLYSGETSYRRQKDVPVDGDRRVYPMAVCVWV